MIWIIYSEHIYQEKAPSTQFIVKIKNDWSWDLEIKNYQLFSMIEIDNEIKVFYDNILVENYPQMVLLRVDKILSKLKFIEYLEQLGIRVINSSDAIKKATDKYQTYLLLKENNIKTPKTKLITSRDNYDSLSTYFNSSDFIVKATHGSKGDSVYLICNEADWIKVAEFIFKKAHIAQEYIRSSYGRDIRVVVLNEQCLTSMIRENKHDFKSNLATGGVSTPYQCSPVISELAIKTTRVLGLYLSGIDILYGEKDGEYYICEANSNPGIRIEGLVDRLEPVIIEMIKSYKK